MNSSNSPPDRKQPRNTAPTFVVALDEASLEALADRVADRLRAAPAATSSATYLVGPRTPAGEIPIGHTVRELYDAARAGKLDARMTPKGLVISDEALRAYEAARRRRRVKPANDAEPPSVARSLAQAGVALTRGGRR